MKKTFLFSLTFLMLAFQLAGICAHHKMHANQKEMTSMEMNHADQQTNHAEKECCHKDVIEEKEPFFLNKKVSDFSPLTFLLYTVSFLLLFLVLPIEKKSILSFFHLRKTRFNIPVFIQHQAFLN